MELVVDYIITYDPDSEKFADKDIYRYKIYSPKESQADIENGHNKEMFEKHCSKIFDAALTERAKGRN